MAKEKAMKYKQDLNWYRSNYSNYEWERKESLHYLFHFKKESLAQKDSKDIIKLKEKHHTEICSWLGVNNQRKIDYYLYPSIKGKKALMGDDSPGNAIWEELEQGVSKKFEIHVVYSDKCKFIGEHEDMHLLSLSWGLSIYLFCEGLAQYMEDGFMGEDLHLIALELAKEKKLYSLKELCDNKNWDQVASEIIYPQVGSLAKYLIEQYGKDKFKQVYQITSRHLALTENLAMIEKVYLKDINQLEKEWINYIKIYEKS